MTQPCENHRCAGIGLGRIGVFILLTALFAAAASIFGPFASSARPRSDAAPEIVTRDGNVLLGRTLGRDYTLFAYATRDGVRYSVTSARGRVLAEDLEAADVYRQFPDLDPGNLHTGPDDVSGRLMMVDPDR